MTRFHWLVCSFMLAVVCLAVPARAASVYTFEGLATGNLIGQDNWLHANTAANTGAEAQVQAGTGFDSTLVARSNTGNVQVSRQNDGNFSFGTINSAIPIALQADFLFNLDLDVFRIESDEANSAPFDSTPYFGFTGNTLAAAGFAFRAAHNGASTNVLLSTAAPEIQQGDWVRINMYLDMAANGGDGSARLSYQDLTLGQAGFTPIAGLQNVAAGLLNNALANKYTFDRMYFRGGTSQGGQQIDNLTVDLNPVPEPTGIALWVLVFVGMFGCRWRNTSR
jgi:hypothetical protein